MKDDIEYNTFNHEECVFLNYLHGLPPKQGRMAASLRRQGKWRQRAREERGAALDSDANRLGRHRIECTPRQSAQKRWAARGTRSYASTIWDLPINTKGERHIGQQQHRWVGYASQCKRRKS